MTATSSAPPSVEGALQLARDEVTAAEWQVERQRQATLREKHSERERLHRADEDHRRQMDSDRAARKRILDEMRVVRENVHSKLVKSKAKNVQSTSVAGRALAHAGKRALDAKSAAEASQERAAEVEARANAAVASGQQALAKTQAFMSARLSEEKAHSMGRAVRHQRLVEESATNYEQFEQVHSVNCAAQERHQEQVARLRVNGAAAAVQEANFQVAVARQTSNRAQQAAMRELEGTYYSSASQITEAQRTLIERRRICEASVETERVCSAQGRRIAGSMKGHQDTERNIELQRMEANLQRLAAHCAGRLEKHEAAHPIEEERKQAWEAFQDKALDTAKARADDEELRAQQRVDAAKVALANLQAKSAAYIRELQSQWEKAQQVDVARLDAARARTEELRQYCEERIQECEGQCSEMLRRSEQRAEAGEAVLKERACAIDEDSKQRVEMAQRQARERREQAEQRLEHKKKHVEEVRALCKERVQQEVDTAAEKVSLAKKSTNERQQRLEQRKAEALERRNIARTKYAAAIARCEIAAAEARRRGLLNIAEEFEPPELHSNAGTTLQPQFPVQAPQLALEPPIEATTVLPELSQAQLPVEDQLIPRPESSSPKADSSSVYNRTASTAAPESPPPPEAGVPER